jgi:hypothetical protein
VKQQNHGKRESGQLYEKYNKKKLPSSIKTEKNQK